MGCRRPGAKAGRDLRMNAKRGAAREREAKRPAGARAARRCWRLAFDLTGLDGDFGRRAVPAGVAEAFAGFCRRTGLQPQAALAVAIVAADSLAGDERRRCLDVVIAGGAGGGLRAKRARA